ncbi:hypothetical protein RQP54_15075 [Curvibacter sp. APW13]|nr:hypothetical protein [Curvibacter sp. APW13]MDT8992193.1 hypothetical protein [Curvibacter sp. APW13]
MLWKWFRLQHLLDQLFDDGWICLGLDTAPAPGWEDDALFPIAYPAET